MNNFKFVYKILSALEQAMDYPDFDKRSIGYETLGITKYRWVRYLEMMTDCGYIKGVEIESFMNGECDVNVDDIRITLKGLEYLQENSIMQKIYRTAKGINEFVH